MTSRQWRQVGLLGALGSLLAVLVVRQLGVDPQSDPGAPPVTATRQVPRSPVDTAVVDVRLERLNVTESEPPESSRNPFRFLPRPEPPPDLASGPRPGTPVPPVAIAPAPRPEAQGPPPPPPITLRFIGLVDPASSDARAAIFSDQKGNVFGGREGDVIEGRYRVLRVGADSAELAYLDGRGRQTIRLSGQ